MRRTIMAGAFRSNATIERLVQAWRNRGLSVKAISFASIGVINALVDYSVFLATRALLERTVTGLAALGAVAGLCRCGSPTTLSLVLPNVVAWSVAVSGSYLMNSSITFAAESGRKLRWSAYFAFVASGIAGLIANTATLLVTVELLLLPVLVGKAVAVFASFAVNFSLSHLVVFRRRR
jgi:putative flippase GtrA